MFYRAVFGNPVSFIMQSIEIYTSHADADGMLLQMRVHSGKIVQFLTGPHCQF